MKVRVLAALAAAVGVGALSTTAAFAGISFTQVYSGISARPGDAAFGDVNGDGKIDAVLGVSGAIQIMLGDGTGHFSAGALVSTPGTSYPDGVAVADMNGDGRADLVYSGNGSGLDAIVGVLLQNADGTFTSAGTWGLASVNPTPLAVTDLNGDGKPDVVVSGAYLGGGGDVETFLGNGDGALGSRTVYDLGAPGWQITPVDVNGDGNVDLAVGTFGGGVHLLVNDGTGGLTDHEFDMAGGSSPAADVADVNGDGILDLIGSDVNGGHVVVRLGTGTLAFGPSTSYASGWRTDLVAVADVDGDGVPDIVAHRDSSGGISVLRGAGDGTFASGVQYGSFNSSGGLALADVDGDGKVDALTADLGGATGGVAAFLNGSTPPATPPVATLSPAGGATTAASGWYDAASSGTGGVTFDASATDPQNVSLLECLDSTTSVLDKTANPAVSPLTGSFSLGDGVHSVSCDATDGLGANGAGAGSTAFPLTIKIDQTPPTVQANVTPATPDGNDGWYATTPTVSFTCSDTGSGLAAACPADATVADGNPTGASATVLDVAGNSATASVSGLKVDTVAPTISASISPSSPDGQNGWYVTQPTVSFDCADGGSGVASCTSPVTLGEGAGLTASGTATDVAGHSSSVTSDAVNVDTTAPVVHVTGIADGASYPAGATVPTPGCDTTDATSGVAQQATVAVTGPAGGIGTFAVTCSGATDVAGNAAAPVTIHYSVVYGWGGFEDTVQNPPSVNSGEAGRTWPLRFDVLDAAQQSVTDLSVVTSIQYEPVQCTSFSSATGSPVSANAAGGSKLRLDGSDFAFEWKTPKTAGCYALLVALADGTVHRADFVLTGH